MEDNRKNSGKKSHLSLILKLIFAVSILGFLFSQIPASQVWAALISMDFSLVVLGVGLSLCAHLVAATMMHQVLKHQEIYIPARKVFSINMIVKYYSLFLPGYLSGGALRWYHFSKPGGKRAQAAAAIVLNRLLQLTAICLIGLSCWFLDGPEKHKVLIESIFIGVVLLPPSAYILLLQPSILKYATKLSQFRLVPSWIRSRSEKVLLSFETFRTIGLLSHLWLLALCVLRILITITSLYVFAYALSIDVSIFTFGWLRVVINFVLMLPVSFSGLGVREASYVFLLAPLGVAKSAAFALPLAVYARGFLFASLGGLLELTRIFSGDKEQIPLAGGELAR